MPAPLNVFDRILEQHGVPDEKAAFCQGNRPKKKIDAIIRDVKAANAQAGGQS